MVARCFLPDARVTSRLAGLERSPGKKGCERDIRVSWSRNPRRRRCNTCSVRYLYNIYNDKIAKQLEETSRSSLNISYNLPHPRAKVARTHAIYVLLYIVYIFEPFYISGSPCTKLTRCAARDTYCHATTYIPFVSLIHAIYRFEHTLLPARRR